VASDPQFMQLVNSGVVSTSAKRDYTLKVDAQGLEPGSAYFYRFLSEGIISPVGQTRTLPEGAVESFRIGVASCSNYPQGYFNVYRHMADSDLDLVLHLGDYIYEYAEGVYANAVATEELGRQVEPATEILTVEDYRMRYGLYRTDPDLQAVHARHPFICVWDDHELANDSWKDGAENHNQGEGDFQARMTAARQAYHEWLPIRTAISGDQGPIFRSFKVGGLADLIMLDTRLHGRDRGLDYAVDLPLRTLSYDVSKTGQGTMVSSADAAVAPAHQRRLVKLPFDFSTGEPTAITDYGLIKDLTAETLPKNWHYLPDTESFKEQMLIDPARALLGADQEQWLDTELQASKQRGATWQLLGQQVLMGKLKLPVLTDQQLKLDDAMPAYREILKMMQLLAPEQLPFNLDAWDGYAVCRDRVYASLAEHGVNPVVLAGDTHNAWAFNLANNMGEAVGVEIGTPSVSSPGLETYLPTDPIVLGNAMVEASAELFAVDTAHRGWSELVLTSQAMTNQWHFVDTILDRQFITKTARKQHCKVGNKRFS
jgi:alkaline phosphatase D